MRQKRNKMSVLALLLAISVSVCATMPAGAQDDSSSVNPRAFWNSLTPAERKLPRDVLIQQRMDAGKAIPPGWERSAQARSKSRSAAPAEQIYRLDGDSLESLETVLSQVGATAISRSSSRGYVTAALSEEQVIEVANYAAVHQIRHVKGPSAQGVTEAWTAHRVFEMDAIGEPGILGNTTTKTGDGVVIGIISRTIKQTDLDALEGELNIAGGSSTCVIPPVYGDSDPPTCQGTAVVYTLSGMSDAEGALHNVISASGTADGLNMLQVMYDIAPDAKFVIASPGDTSTPADMARVIAKLVVGNNTTNTTAADYLPPANIIVDDLDYLTQNPFELDEISEAIVAARAAGAVYVTAAGDGGHYESSNSTSNVYIEDFNSQPPPSATGIYGDIWGNLHMFPGNQPYLELAQALTDVCLFWNEDPNGTTTFNDLTLWIFEDLNDNNTIDNGEPAADWVALTRPGACLSEFGSWSGSPLPVGTKLIIEDFSESVTDRFMIVGERQSTAIVDGSGSDNIAGAFDLSTPGAIRGHAYHPQALTVGASPYAENSDGPVTFKSVSNSLSVNDYSADGEGSAEKRFFWQNVSTSSPDWQAIAFGGLSAAKPDLTATSKISVKVVDGSTVTIQDYHGTSASAAVVAAVSALYWEFRDWQVTTVADEDVFAAVKASTLDGGSPDWDRQFGEGVLDAPRALEIPLPASQATLATVAPGVVQLNFYRALNDLANPSQFTYAVVCTGDSNLPSAGSPENIEPNDVVSDDGAVANAPKLYNATPGAGVSCDITSTHATWGTGGDDSKVTVTATVGGATAPNVTMTAKSAGVQMSFAPSASTSLTTVSYAATCTADGSAISGWTNKTVTPDTIYPFKVDGGVAVACNVTVAADRYNPPGDTNGTKVDTVSAIGSGSATASVPAATTFAVTSDAGGVSVRWTVDPNLIDSTMATVTLNCSQGGTQLVTNQTFTGSGGTFVTADISGAVSCTAVTSITVPGGTTYENSSSPNSGSATPEEEAASSGLPVWLLYVATQPKTVTEVKPSVGRFDENGGEIAQLGGVQVDGSQTVAQTFTAGVSGELTAVTLYLRNSVDAFSDLDASELDLEIRSADSINPEKPSGDLDDVLASEAIAASAVASNGGPAQAVTVNFGTPPTLVSGQVYALVVRSADDEGYTVWRSGNSDIYAGGAAFIDENGSGSGLNTDTAEGYDFTFEIVMRYTQ